MPRRRAPAWAAWVVWTVRERLGRGWGKVPSINISLGENTNTFGPQRQHFVLYSIKNGNEFNWASTMFLMWSQMAVLLVSCGYFLIHPELPPVTLSSTQQDTWYCMAVRFRAGVLQGHWHTSTSQPWGWSRVLDPPAGWTLTSYLLTYEQLQAFWKGLGSPGWWWGVGGDDTWGPGTATTHQDVQRDRSLLTSSMAVPAQSTIYQQALRHTWPQFCYSHNCVNVGDLLLILSEP